MLDMYIYVRNNGILSLEKEAYNDNEIIKMAVDLLVSGTELDIVEDIFKTFIQQGDLTRQDVLEMYVIFKSIIGIQKSFNCRTLAYTLSSLFGKEYITYFCEYLNSDRDSFNINILLNNELNYFKESDDFQETLLNVSREKIEILFRKIDIYTLAWAFKGCDKKFVNIMKHNISSSIFLEIAKLIKITVNDKYTTIESQKFILQKLRELKD